MSDLPRHLAALGCALAALVGASQALAEAQIAGVWMMRPEASPPPEFTPAGKAAYEANRAALVASPKTADPTTQCLPMGFPRNMATRFPIQIVQTPGQVTMIFQAGIRVRRVFTDGRAPEADADPAYNGHSLGRWDGQTLVVETRGFKDTWLDHEGAPHGPDLRAVERIWLSENGRVLFDEITLVDEEMLAKPWTQRRVYERLGDVLISDYICVEHGKDNPRWVSEDGAATVHSVR